MPACKECKKQVSILKMSIIGRLCFSCRMKKKDTHELLRRLALLDKQMVTLEALDLRAILAERGVQLPPPPQTYADLFVEAAEVANIELLSVLLSTGVSINERNNDGLTALIMASQIGNIDTVRFLLQNNADANLRDYKGGSPLKNALRNRSTELVELLIANGADLNAKSSRAHDDTPLGHAIRNSYEEELVELLITSGADVNTKGNDGNSPLHIAAARGQKRFAELLIARGADINIVNNDGNSPPHSAAANGHIKLVELFFNAGADVDTRSKNNSTLLHFAAANGHKELAILLLASGANVNARNEYSDTPVYLAVKNCHCDIAELLFEEGAAPRNNGRLLHAAFEAGRKDILELLISKGQNIHTVWEGHTLLSKAKERGDKEIFNLLLAELKANPLKLTCKKCNQTYLLGLNTICITSEEVNAMFAVSIGEIAQSMMIGLARSDTDAELIQDAYETVLIYGPSRGWNCESCAEHNP